jgi:hypothetical protein
MFTLKESRRISYLFAKIADSKILKATGLGERINEISLTVHINRPFSNAVERKFTPGEKGVDPKLGGYMTFKRTYERWGLKDGEGKLRIETNGGE